MANLLSRLARVADRPAVIETRFSFEDVLRETWASSWRASSSPQGLVALVGEVQARQGLVAAAVAARQALIGQVHFVYRSTARGVDFGRVFTAAPLAPLQQPHPGKVTRSQLLRAAEAHVSYAGNAYFHLRFDGVLELWRPDLVDHVYADVDGRMDPAHADLVGYRYWRHGRTGGAAPEEVLAGGRVAQWRPEPDPRNPWLGLSWVTNVIREMAADSSATQHIERFFQNAATPNAIIRPDRSLTAAEIQQFQELFEKSYGGVGNAYKTWFIGGGSDVTVVGSKLGELALRELQGGFETRIAARSRVPATVLGIREGMAGSALNAGNYVATRRMWADAWFSPTVDDLCEALEKLAPPPAGGPAQLSWDRDAVLFLQEDQKDAADITMANSQAIRALTEAGYEPSSVVAAVTTNDLTKLRHTGVFSVQLQAPGVQQTAGD